MTWQWDEMTSPRFAEAVREADGCCLLPVGVIERHGTHLPLGTDAICVQDVARRAAEIEPAVIFPQYYFGQIHEARHQPGTIAVRCTLLLELLENVCEEIARNGLRKIVLLNGHGGNLGFFEYFRHMLQERPRDFVLHVIQISDYLTPVRKSAEWQAMREVAEGGHAGETETSSVMAVRGDLVDMDTVGDDPSVWEAMGRLKHIPGGTSMLAWYADYPNHHAGDPRTATPEKGEFLHEGYARQVAAIVKAFKADTETKRLADEFYSRCRHGE